MSGRGRSPFGGVTPGHKGRFDGFDVLSEVPRWDPSFVVLAMIASVEAIFLSTFVLISQNRMSAAAEKRADLDLQISLLAEHELTRLVDMVAKLAERQGMPTDSDPEIQEAKRDIASEAVLDELDAARSGSHTTSPRL